MNNYLYVEYIIWYICQFSHAIRELRELRLDRVQQTLSCHI